MCMVFVEIKLMKNIFHKIVYYLKLPYYKIKLELEYRKRIKQLRKQDPFIYN